MTETAIMKALNDAGDWVERKDLVRLADVKQGTLHSVLKRLMAAGLVELQDPAAFSHKFRSTGRSPEPEPQVSAATVRVVRFGDRNMRPADDPLRSQPQCNGRSSIV